MEKTPTKYNEYLVNGFIIAIAGSLLFSTKAIIVKLAFIDLKIDAISLLALRMVFALPFYIGAALIAGRNKTKDPLTRNQWLYIIILGLAGYYLSSLFDFIGLKYISAGLERLILFLYPTFTVFLHSFLFKQKIKSFQKWALILTYIGIGIAYSGEFAMNSGNVNFIKGSIYILLCAILFAVYTTGSGRIIPKTGATRFTAYAMMASTIGVLVHYSFSGTNLFGYDHSVWWYGLVLGVVATVIPSFFISNGIKKIGASNVAIISSIGPVSTILQAHFLLGEKMLISQIIGTVLVIIGVILIGWKNSEV